MEGAALGQLPPRHRHSSTEHTACFAGPTALSTPHALLDPQPRLLAEHSGDLGVNPDVGHIPLG